MRRLRFVLLAALTAIVCFMASGCWDLVEVNRSSLLTGIALEPGKENKIKVTFEILNTAEAMHTEGSKGGAAVTLYTDEADTIAGAVHNLNHQLDRLLLGSHVRVIVIDERLARRGLNRFIDFAQRTRYIREDVTLLVAKGVKASDLLRIAYPGGMYASLKMEAQIENFNTREGGVPRSYLYEVARTAFTEGKELVLAAMTAEGSLKKSESAESAKSLEPEAIAKCVGSAVFQEDRLIGYLDVPDTTMALLAGNKLRTTMLNVPLSGEKQFASVRLVHFTTSMKVRMDGGTPVIRLHVQGSGNLVSSDANLPLDKVSGYAELERLSEQVLNERLKSTVERVQRQFKSDIFGFGEHLYRHRYRQFKKTEGKWNELFANARLEVTSSISLERTELKTRKLEREQEGR